MKLGRMTWMQRETFLATREYSSLDTLACLSARKLLLRAPHRLPQTGFLHTATITI